MKQVEQKVKWNENTEIMILNLKIQLVLVCLIMPPFEDGRAYYTNTWYTRMWNVQKSRFSIGHILFYAANKEPTLYEKFLKNPKSVPLITSRKLENCNKYRQPRQAWLETLSTVDDHKLGMLDLHPDVFAVHPRYYSSFFLCDWHLTVGSNKNRFYMDSEIRFYMELKFPFYIVCVCFI